MFHSWTILHMLLGNIIFSLGLWVPLLHLWQTEPSNSLSQPNSTNRANQTWLQGLRNISVTLVFQYPHSFNIWRFVYHLVMSFRLTLGIGKVTQVVILHRTFVFFYDQLTSGLLRAVSSGMESRENHNYVSGLVHHPVGTCISTCALINLFAKSGLKCKT